MRSVYFSEKELECPCCGKSDMDAGFLSELDNLRGKAGIPLVLNSAFRCRKQNDLVGGVRNSAHLHGKAVDIRAKTSRTRHKILKAAYSMGLQQGHSSFFMGFRRIGIAKGFIHVDTDDFLPQDATWTY